MAGDRGSPGSGQRAALRYYRRVLGWPVQAQRHTTRLMLGKGMAGIDIALPWADGVIAGLAEAGITGPTVGYPTGQAILLTHCAHAGNPLLFTDYWPDLDHLGGSAMIALPPTLLSGDPDRPVVWRHDPQPVPLPDCGTVLTVVLGLLTAGR